MWYWLFRQKQPEAIIEQRADMNPENQLKICLGAPIPSHPTLVTSWARWMSLVTAWKDVWLNGM